MSKSTYLKIPLPPEIGEEEKESLRGIFRSFVTCVIHDLEEKSVKNYNFMMKERLSSKEKVTLLNLLSEFKRRHSEQKVLGESLDSFNLPISLLERMDYLGGRDGSLP